MLTFDLDILTADSLWGDYVKGDKVGATCKMCGGNEK
jgi:hypothetical protein